MKNGGWLDSYADGGTMQEHQENYNDASVSLPEGFVGDGYNKKGRNYSPAWGGQFQMGGSIPGSVGFSYARTQSPAPSNGKYAKKTMASAQDGKNVEYDYVNYGTPEYKKAYEQGQFAELTNPLDEVVVTPYDKQFPYYQQLTPSEQKYLRENINSNDPISRQLKARAVDGRGLDADKATDFAKAWAIDLPLSSLQVPQSALVEGVEGLRGNDFNMLNALDPSTQRIPSETWGIENPYAAFAVDAITDPEILLGMSLLKQPLQKGLQQTGRYLTEETALRNAHKYNPWAFKLNESNYYRQVSKEAIDDALSSKLIREKGEVVSPENYAKFQDQLEDLAGTKEYLNHEDKYKAMYNNSHGPMPYFQKGELFYKDKPTLTIREKDVPIKERKKVNLDHLIESNYSPENFQNSYGYKMSLGNPEEVGSVGILKPDPTLRDLENFNLYKKNWLKGYKEIPKQEEGGIIKDDRGQWAYPGEITEIGSNQITMEGVPYDVLGISDTGDTKLMKPGKNYKFKGKKVTEFPMAKNGLRQEQKGLQNLDNLTNFTNYNKPQPGGWLNKYN
jgi:hypothetical protein